EDRRARRGREALRDPRRRGPPGVEMKLAYYPGCVAQESGKELDMATRWVCQKLGIELAEFPNFSCCGSGFIDEANSVLNVALNARNLAIAEKAGLDLMTVCS